ncbi:MAG: MerR family transcriptional regulator [Acidocella sp. 20-57-95]|nr:MAG: MerR family transcriptional regulator [Acidocella sp. 20-57-95]OYV62298.1 MAG: MerR family transcriptional regulator [Acidocella sp. 21-58-7]HQT63949.1 MerR family DNA-binding transcriptional regulator [Acidocella sp.]HQU03238.1 MerR family DNA-binding transcriptional regulator [Acidocella sp.]
MAETMSVEEAEIAAANDAVALYSVSQLARQLGVTARTIRFYEDKNLISPQRAGTTRVYTHRDRARLMLILRGKRLGFSLREIKEFLDLYDVDPAHHVQLRQLLAAVRKRMVKLSEQRAAIDESLSELTEIERQSMAILASRNS